MEDTFDVEGSWKSGKGAFSTFRIFPKKYTDFKFFAVIGTFHVLMSWIVYKAQKRSKFDAKPTAGGGAPRLSRGHGEGGRHRGSPTSV